MKPRIRIKGFEGEWKKVLLSECLSIRNEQNANNEYDVNDVLSVSDDFGVCNQIELLGRSYAGKSLTNYGIVKTGDIVYTKSPLKAKPFGIVKANHSVNGIVSCLYGVYVPNEDVCSDFIEKYFETAQRLNKYIRPFVNKGAKNTMNISDEAALQGYIMMPEYEEQRAIASYFTHLDELISASTSRLASLKQIKAASLQTMFPQEGETTPRLRFKGFEGEWNKVKADTIFTTTNERNHAELPVLSATQDKGMVTRESIGYNVSHDKSNEATYKRILPGQFAIHLRSFQGGFAHSSIEGICSPAYTILDFKDKTLYDDIFWKYVLISKQFIKSLELVTFKK